MEKGFVNQLTLNEPTLKTQTLQKEQTPQTFQQF